MKISKNIIHTCAAALLLGSSAHAAIIVQDSYTGGTSTTDTTTEDNVWTISAATLDLSAATADKLVVGFTQRRNESFTVTYGGVSMETAVSRVASSTNDGSAGIFYLDTFTLDGDLVITTTGATEDFAGRSLFAFVLSGTADGGPVATDSDNQQTDPTVVSLTTGAAGGFVYAAYGINGSGNDTNLTHTGGRIAGFTTAQAHQSVWNDDSPTTYTVSMANNDSVGVMANFAPIPEPSSLALLGLTGCLLAVRRRRHA